MRRPALACEKARQEEKGGEEVMHSHRAESGPADMKVP
jgi:hypothetical protein